VLVGGGRERVFRHIQGQGGSVQLQLEILWWGHGLFWVWRFVPAHLGSPVVSSPRVFMRIIPRSVRVKPSVEWLILVSIPELADVVVGPVRVNLAVNGTFLVESPGGVSVVAGPVRVSPTV